jgi:hypothetical protein
MSFADLMKSDAQNAILGTAGEFVEAITYTPAGGTAKVIQAVVVREQIEPAAQGNNRILAGTAELYILADATLGIATVKKGEDKVSLPVWLGETAATWSVAEIISKDDAMYHLRIRR